MSIDTFIGKLAPLAIGFCLVHAGIVAQILDQPSDNTGWAGSDPNFAGGQVLAENFVAGSAVNVAQVVVYGVYSAGVVATTDAFDIYIHDDAAGLPGTVVGGPFLDVVPASRTATGNSTAAQIEYRYVINFPAVPLAAGTYHIELFNSAADGNPWGWSAGTLDGANGISDLSISLTAPGVVWQLFEGGDRAIQIFDAALPVELAELMAVADGARINVSWTTASETKTAGFDVEVSSDRYTFERVGFVDGAGTSNESNTYSYGFEAPAPGINYVRLRQVDFDGAFEFSPVVEVQTEVPGGLSLLAAYPNPISAGQSASLSFVVDTNAPARLEVFDALGRPVQTLFDGPVSAGALQIVPMHSSGLPTGIYLARLMTPTRSDTRIITIVR